MRVVSEFSRAVTVIDNTWVPMRDGTRLAAKLWLPKGAETDPVPAVFEFIPYRKGDGTARRDELLYQYLAGHGYAGVRVDLRGAGESDGLPDDEYAPQEQRDGVDAIAWIADQPWCTGAVGMTGISWGGFNSLQIAAERPPALKAIVTLCSTDDRYADDVHYKGGCVSGLDMLHWATYMVLGNAQPPDPAVVGDRWREMWLARAESVEPLIATWMGHQRRDAYWKHGSVCEDYANIEAAVWAVGGWQDGYTNAIPRLMRGLSGPRKALIGPWGHDYPEVAHPGPQVGFLQEMVRFWDRWLKDEDNGVMDEPMVRAWVQDTVPPAATQLERPGRWVTADAWPPSFATARTLYLNDDGLGDEPGAPGERSILGRQVCGFDAGAWCGEGTTADDPDDQRADDGMSLTFDSAPLEDDLHILGYPVVTLELSSDRPLALVAVRLCEVSPSGTSLAVTRTVLNLAHRDGHEHPSPLEPGRGYRIPVELDVIGHHFSAGNRIRVAISPTYWPWAWPSPEPVTLTVGTGASTLELPVIPASAGDQARPWEEPEVGPELPVVEHEIGHSGRTITRDVHAGRTDMSFLWGSGGDTTFPSGIRVKFDNDAHYSIVEGDPLSASVRCYEGITFSREETGWRARVEANSEMSCDADVFRISTRLDLYEGNARVFVRTWTHEIPRDHG